MKKLIFTTILVIVTLVFTSCSNDYEGSSLPISNTIANFIGNTSDYSSLKASLEKADLTSVLSGPVQYTVFAPNNDAFDAFLLNNGFSTLEDVSVSVLQKNLLSHVVQWLNVSSTLTTGYVKTLAEETSTSNKIDMYLNTTNGVEINGNTVVVTTDI